MAIDIRRRMSGENRRGDLRGLVRSRASRRVIESIPCGSSVRYPQSSEQIESDFYYALNTPSNEEFYNPVTGLTMLYTDTTSNLGPLDEVGVVILTSTSLCVWTALRYGTTELENFIKRGHTVIITIEIQGPFNCFGLGDKSIVDSWLSSLGASGISIVRDNLLSGCQSVTNYAASNRLNDGLSTWRVGGTSRFTVSGAAVSVVQDVSGNILVAASVSTLSGNTKKGKVIVFGDTNTINDCDSGSSLQTLYDNICAAIGKEI